MTESGAYETPIRASLEVKNLGPGLLTPYEFHVTEALSGMFRVEVLCACEPESVLLTDLVRQEGTFVLDLSGAVERLFNGLITEAEEWNVGGPRAKRIRLVIEPRLWKLAQGRTSRIFQRQTVRQIVEKVLGGAAVAQDWQLGLDHPAREYCVEYMESDFAFVSRLLEEEGITYFFRHQRDGHTMVLSDHNGNFLPIEGEPSVPYREGHGLVTSEDAVFELTSQSRIRPGTVSLRDFDPLRPALNLAVKASGDGDAELEIYRHHGRYNDPNDGQRLARIELERQRWQTQVMRGASHCGRLAPGRTFQLAGHPDDALDHEYLITSVSHHGACGDLIHVSEDGASAPQPPEYSNRFEAIDSGTPFRPLRSAPWPAILGAQTAMVTGPAGEEIYTDEHGRVKVQFHWDREGRHDESTTCWVRVNQGWAGPGWGNLFLPRIGHEVIVEFEDGNPDRPLVTGRVYNGASPPPLNLPGDKTQSTVRSSSSPGGGGFNQLLLEDAAGQEQVYLHAQKDLVMLVKNDKQQLVKGNETLEVKLNRSREIQGNQMLMVKGNDDSTVALNQSLTVEQNRSTVVAGNHTESVSGTQSIAVGNAHSLTVALASSETIGAAKALTVGAAMSVAVGAAMVETIAGGLSESVGGSKSETVGGDRSETVGGDRSVDVSGDWSETIGKTRSVKVTGDAILGVSGNLTQTVKKALTLDAKEIHFAAKDELQIKVGDASILMKKNGDVIIKGGKIELTASGDMILKGSKIGQN